MSVVAMVGDAPQQVVTYAFKPSFAGQPRRFELTNAGMSFWTGRRSHLWPYASIKQVRLSYRPVSMQKHRFRADIVNSDGARITVISATWSSIAVITAQDDAYRAFVTELHKRILGAGADVAFDAGLKRPVYGLALMVLACVATALAGLFARALITGAPVAGVFMVGFAALFGWQVGGWVLRNRPATYDPEHLPPALLP